MPSVAQIDGLNIPGGAPAITAPVAAYSVRLLDSALGVPTYTGAAMRVRRETGGAGDDDEADIAFDSGIISLDSAISNASAGVTATTLGQFINVGEVDSIVYSNPDSLTVTASCLVNTWYDQSGNGNDAEQTAQGSQPQIHDGTADTDLILENGKPAVDFDGTNDHFEIGWTQAASNYSLHAVTKNTATNSFLFDSEVGRLVFDGRGGSRGVYFDGSWRGTMHSGTAQQLQSIYAIAPSSGQSYVDGSQINTGLSYTQTAIGSTTSLGSEKDGDQLNFNGTIQEWILYASDETSNRSDIEDNINSEYLIYQPTTQPTSGLLYDYGSATGGTDAAAAYSVRQLSDKAVLCMRIRRDMGAGNPGDDDETNIGFDANGDLDTQAISDFCGTGTGWVTRWWDQSVNGNHADQPVGGTGSSTSQPQIYNGTAVITENGKPAIEWDGSDDNLKTTSAIFSGTTARSIFITGRDRSSTASSTSGIISPNINSTPNGTNYTITSEIALRVGQFAEFSDDFLSANLLLLTNIWTSGNATDADFYLNGTALTNTTGNSDVDLNTVNLSFFIGKTGYSGDCTQLTASEFVIWNIDQSSNRTGIETDIDTYFSIT